MNGGRRRSSGTVFIRAAEHTDYGDLLLVIVDSVEHAVGTTTRAMTILQRWSELPDNSVGIVEQRTVDELLGSERH